MIVEDESAHAEAIRRALKRSGTVWETRVTSSLKEYREAVASRAPDIVLIDLNLPDGRAVDILTAPPEDGPFPIIIMTGSGDEKTAVEVMKSGALNYIVKSPEAFAESPRTLVRTLREWSLLKKAKQKDEELRQSEERYRTITENMTDTVWVMDMGLKNTYISPSVIKTRGFTLDELNTLPLEKQLTPQSLAIVGRVMAEEMTPERLADKDMTISRSMELEFYRKDGSTFWGDIVMTLVRDAEGRPKEIIGVGRDITERNKANEALRKAAVEWRTTFDSITDLISIHDADYRIVRVNKAFADFLEMSPKDLIGRLCYEVIHGTKEPPPFCPHRKALETKKSIEEEIYEPQRGIFIHLTDSPIMNEKGDVVGSVHVMKNITERKRADDALKESEEKYRSLVENINDVVFNIDLNGKIVYISPVAEAITGYSVDEYKEKNLAEFIHPEDLPRAISGFERSLKGIKGETEFRAITKNGSYRYLRSSSNPIVEAGSVVGLTGLITDITERKQAEQALRESEEKHRTILHTIEDGYFEVDLKGSFTSFNESMRGMLGYDQKEMAGLNYRQYMDKETAEKVFLTFNEVFRTGIPAKTMGWRLTRKDGATIDIETSISLKRDNSGVPTGFFGIARDISGRRRMEEALRQSEAFTKAVLDNLPVGIAVNSIDPTVTFDYMNDNFPRFYRTTREKLVGPDAFWSAVYEEPEFREQIKKRVLDDCAGGDPARMYWADIPITRTGQETSFVTAGNIPVPDKPLMISTVWDVTERKRAEEALLASETRYRSLFEAAKDGILILDADTGRIVDVNPFIKTMLGYSHEELLGKELWEISVFKDIAANKENFLELKEKGYIRYEDLPLQTRDGRSISVEFVSNVYLVNHAKVVQCNIRDITGEKRAKEALKKEQQDILLILNSSPVIIFYIDKEGKFIRVNKTFAEALKMPGEEIIGKTVYDLYTPKVAQGMADDNQEVIKSGRPKLNIIEFYESAGGIRWVRTDKVPIYDENNRVIGLAGFAEDITERMRAEEELKKSQERYRELVENIEDIVYVTDGTGKVIFLNNAFERISGYTQQEMLRKNYMELLTPESRKEVLELFKKQKKGRDLGVFEMSFFDKDRTVKTIEVRERHIFEGGRIVEVHGLGRDVTDRKRAEEALRDSEEKFRSLFRTSRDFLSISNLEGTITEVNDAALEFFGYSSEEIPRTRMHDLYADPEDRQRFINAVLENGYILNKEIRMKKKDGEIINALVTANLIRDSHGNPIGLFGSARDITERKKMEQQLLQSEKLSAVGTMISGVAHELNNPLTSIIGNAQLLAKRDVPEDIKSKLNVILKESIRSSKIVGGLLAFAREHKPERKMIGINDILMESLKLREYDLRVSNIDTRTSLSDDLPETFADPFQLQQVFINLINNARDAIAVREEGALVIRTYRKGESILIEFEDNGPGISAGLVKKIFDPFFTTKEVGKGTGLGLSIAYGIIKEHGGTILVESRPGKGAKFIVTIPITKGAQPVKKKANAPEKTPPGARTVLVVEDEASLRDLLADALTESGFFVEAASAGEEAIRLLETRKYDAVLSDIKMPGVGGRELYLYIQKHHPEIAEKIVFMTGDILSKDTQSFLQITNNRFIEKPFNVDALVALLNDMLSE